MGVGVGIHGFSQNKGGMSGGSHNIYILVTFKEEHTCIYTSSHDLTILYEYVQHIQLCCYTHASKSITLNIMLPFFRSPLPFIVFEIFTF